MKYRPQVQFRFRDESQFEGSKLKATETGKSLNEWLCSLVDAVVPATPEEKVVKAKEKADAA